MHPKFVVLLNNGYTRIKTACPGEGRRKWQLRVLQAFWASILTADDPSHSSAHPNPSQMTTLDDDDDPLDDVVDSDQSPGLLIRTDYSDEEAWATFHALFRMGEERTLDMLRSASDAPDSNKGGPDAPGEDVDMCAEDDREPHTDESSDEDLPISLIKTVNYGHEQDRASVTDISNLTALRLFNDVDMRSSLVPPEGNRRISSPNPLIDCKGWQEVYTGKNIWVYDARSNVDRCVRVVSQKSDHYGIATGDSWRAKAAYIGQLQLDMSFGAQIDFAGLDRYDIHERERNLSEALLAQSQILPQ